VLVVVTYDVSTETAAGRRRLRRVALVCQDFGQRVQKSVFECIVNETGLAELERRLKREMDPSEDSIRIYLMHEDARRLVRHFGVGKPRDLDGPLVV